MDEIEDFQVEDLEEAIKVVVQDDDHQVDDIEVDELDDLNHLVVEENQEEETHMVGRSKVLHFF